LWSEAVNDFKGFPGFDRQVKKIIQTAREDGDEGGFDIRKCSRKRSWKT
jgi:hypothetical protein